MDFGEDKPIDPEKQAQKKRNKTLRDFFWAFFFPMVIGKSMILQFGAWYSDEPGAGWGYWLTGAICFTLFNLGRFLWTYRNYKD